MAQTGGGEPRLEGQDTDQGDTRNRGLTDPYANFETEEPEVTYTDYLCNKKPTVWQARVLIMFIFFVAGATQSYQSVIILELQEKGATYSDQAKFSIASYPYLLKILYAPLLDTYFLKSVGKCKTYVTIGMTLLGILLVILSPGIQAFTVPKNMNLIVLLWFCVNCIITIFQIAGEMWMVKIFDTDDEKSQGSIVFDTGVSLGSFLSYNVLIPLSDLKWLNSKRAPDNQLTHPYMTHQVMLFAIGATSLMFSIVIFFSVAEKTLTYPNDRQDLCKVIKVAPKFFTNKTMRDFMIFIFVTKAIRQLFGEAITLKMIDQGLSKTSLVNTDTVTFPLYLITNWVLFKIIKKGSIVRMYLWMVLYTCVQLLLRYLVYLDLKTSRNSDRAVTFLYVLSFLDRFANTSAVIAGYINIITQQEVGATFLTLMFCWLNMAGIIPNTIGLKMTDWLGSSFDIAYLATTGLQIVTFFYYFEYSKKLDSMEKDEYSLV